MYVPYLKLNTKALTAKKVPQQEDQDLLLTISAIYVGTSCGGGGNKLRRIALNFSQSKPHTIDLEPLPLLHLIFFLANISDL